MDIVIFFVILLLLVIIHEFGHYIVAKKSGIRVEEFGFGLPPRLFGKKFGKKPSGDDDRTLFSVNLLPIGGFVRLSGEDDPYSDPNDPKSFQNAALWKKMCVVSAGVVMNFILGIVIFSIVYSYIGIPSNPLVIEVLVKKIATGSPAEQAGFHVDDKILSVDGKLIKDSGELSQIIVKHAGTSAAVQVERGSDLLTISVIPRLNPPPGQGALGVELGQKVKTTFYPWYQMPFYGAVAGMRDTVEMARQIVPALKNLVVSIVSTQKVPEGVSGPVGIAKASKLFCNEGILPCLQFAGLLSINLAVFNLLPFPALDGGRFAFMLYEAITRRKVNAKFESWTHAVGFALLIILLLFVTYNDIVSKGILK